MSGPSGHAPLLPPPELRGVVEGAADAGAPGEPPIRARSGPVRAAATLIGWYQYVISPFLPRRCRFWPTCSEYTRLAILRHGLVRGVALGLRRLLRCHPFGSGGIDPPP